MTANEETEIENRANRAVEDEDSADWISGTISSAQKKKNIAKAKSQKLARLQKSKG